MLPAGSSSAPLTVTEVESSTVEEPGVRSFVSGIYHGVSHPTDGSCCGISINEQANPFESKGTWEGFPCFSGEADEKKPVLNEIRYGTDLSWWIYRARLPKVHGFKVR